MFPILLHVPPAYISYEVVPSGAMLQWDCSPDQVEVVPGRGFDALPLWFSGRWFDQISTPESSWTWSGYGSGLITPTTCAGNEGSPLLMGVAGTLGFFDAAPGEAVISLATHTEEGLWVYALPGSQPAATLFAFAGYDVDRNNQLELQEFFDYLTGWFSRSNPSDLNQDAVVDVFDIFAFLTAMQ